VSRDANPPKRRGRSLRKGSPRRFATLGFWCALAIVILIAAYVQALLATRPNVPGKRLTYSSFVDLVERGRIDNTTILDQDSYVVGKYRPRGDSALATFNVPYLKTASRDRLVQTLVQNRVPVRIDQQFGKSLIEPVTLVIPALIFIVMIFYFVMSYRRGTGLFGLRSGARRASREETRATFDDVAAQNEAVTELRELAQYLGDPERVKSMGARMPKGVLLYGPPGCGKTLLARALAGESGAAFYSISGSDFVELYVGVGAARVRDLFREARENAPAIVFIDEIDAVGRRRIAGPGASGGSSEEQGQALNQILAEMDGFTADQDSIVVGATNRPQDLDPALLRPGRFDRTISVDRPDEEGRLEILALHANGKPLGDDVDLRVIASRASGLTGADLESLVNEAALFSARADRAKIAQSDFEDALRRNLEAPERQRRLAMRDRSIGRRATHLDHRVTFGDVAGQDAAIDELKELVSYLSERERFAELGARIPRGILLYGPPGCGKTLLARAVAGEAHAAFYSVTASEFVERYAGMAAARVRDLFAEAKSAAPAILFIDELDSIGLKRTGDGAVIVAGSEQEQALNQILAEMDGFSPTEGLIVLAATNRPDMLDPGLLRPGRFDRTVGLERPSEKDRLAVLQLHGKTRRLAPGADLDGIAKRAYGLTGADLANVINEAALLASRAGKEAVTQDELDEALRRVIEEPERQRRLSTRDRTIGRRAGVDQERVTFADVAGVEDAVEELSEIKDYLADPGRYADVGARVPRGVLLTGPPGTGKTLLARAVAGEANAAFFSASGSDFVEIWVGQGAARVRDFFAEAKAVAPAIVFIDEIDALGARRGGSSGGSREYQQTLNQLLVELDGFEPRTGVILMGATNRPDILDQALLRPGRFDRRVEVALPNKTGRRAILDVHAKDKRLADEVDLDGLAGATQGFAGADLANVVNEAALLATRKRLPEVTREVMDEALERVVLGLRSRQHIPTDEERRSTAYHEAGHALVGLALPGINVPHRISIVPRGRALGFVLVADEEELATHSRSRLINEMAMGLAGRVAEKLVTGELSSGAYGDLEQVNRIARRMIHSYGMSEALGGLSFAVEYDEWGRPDLSRYSEEEKRQVYTEVKRLLDEAEQLARRAITEHRAILDGIAERLLEQETMTADELKAIYASYGDGATEAPRAAAEIP
jgi:ATP-dependent metalloprotease FtsH